MKKLLTLSMVLLTALSLTVTAHADVIIESPGDIALRYAMNFLTFILVAAVVLITIFLLIKFWKKK